MWLPEQPGSAVARIEEGIGLIPGQGEEGAAVDSTVKPLAFVERLGEEEVSICDDTRVAKFQCHEERKGGTVVSINLKRRRWVWGRESFDSLRYPLVTTFGALFVAWLGLGRAHMIPSGVYGGCVWLMSTMAACFWLMWGVEYLRESAQNARVTSSPDFLDALGHLLLELGAQAEPVTEHPFRR